MDWDILKKEQEYYKQNELIESKTRALLQKVDDVMKMQENVIKDSNIRVEPSYNKPITHQYAKERIEHISSGFSEISIDDPSVPNVDLLNNMGQKGMHHFYRAKIKALKQENEKLIADLKGKNTDTKQLQNDLNHATEEKDKWFLHYGLGKSQITKLENQVTSLNAKLQARDAENCCMKKEIDNLKKEIKTISQTLNANELKLNKALEENEKNKITLKTQKKEEKDLKEKHKKQIHELTSTVQQIEKHKNELIYGFKKQLQLIDNLKKQKVHLESFNLSQLAEAEFMKILDWKGD